MKEDKIITADGPKEAEAKMNKYAQQGRVVKAVTTWKSLSVHFMITLEKDKDESVRIRERKN